MKMESIHSATEVKSIADHRFIRGGPFLVVYALLPFSLPPMPCRLVAFFLNFPPHF